ncbi:hypothetical protein EES40_00550 [Streptomyces sp. ADI93-02]|nr:hypothetical protein EES40_00550 [Streptomyces sp. ADI93-02]
MPCAARHAPNGVLRRPLAGADDAHDLRGSGDYVSSAYVPGAYVPSAYVPGAYLSGRTTPRICIVPAPVSVTCRPGRGACTIEPSPTYIPTWLASLW